MAKIDRRTAIKLTAAGVGAAALQSLDALSQDATPVFGAEFPNLESLTTGAWWKRAAGTAPARPRQGAGPATPAPPMDVPRDQVVAFAVYLHHSGVLKMTAQLYPLKPEEERAARLELLQNGKWIEAARAEVLYPGWDAHFRIEAWDGSRDVKYRVRHGETAMFEGTIRRDPIEKDEIVVANMSCNSSRTTGLRPEIIDNLKYQDPDLLFFAGDQTYRHTEHTAGWIEFGLQFREVLRDRPAICIRMTTMLAMAICGVKTANNQKSRGMLTADIAIRWSMSIKFNGNNHGTCRILLIPHQWIEEFRFTSLA